MVQARTIGLVEVIEEAIRAASVETHTAIPGRVVSYDAATQTATVAVGIQREFENPDGTIEAVSVPELESVPVMFPRAGGFSITFPVAVGDKCLLVFAERDISAWRQLGTEVAPPESRRHAYSDAVALLGLWPSTNPISPAPSVTALQIRSDDGATKIDISAAGVEVTTDGATGTTFDASGGPFTVDASGAITLTRGANELLAVISAALAAIAAGVDTGSYPFNAATIAAINAQKALIDAMRT